MSRSYWCVIFALGLIIAALPPQYCRAQEQQQSNQEDIRIPYSPYWSLSELYDGEQIDDPCDQGEDNRNSDLCAQWKAADAAKISADWTRRAFWLGTVGAVIGFFTFLAAGAAAVYARSAAKYTEDSARAARDSIDASREIGQAQVRSYIDITSAKIGHDGDNNFLIFSCKILNTGQSPAINGDMVIKVSFHRGQFRHDFNSAMILGSVPTTGFEFPTVSLNWAKVNSEVFSSFEECDLEIFLYSIDVFKKESLDFFFFARGNRVDKFFEFDLKNRMPISIGMVQEKEIEAAEGLRLHRRGNQKPS